mgnify:CR=1 FL=1
MLTLKDKFQIDSDVALRGMIEHCRQTYTYLEVSDSTFAVCKAMLETPFMLDNRPTPIRSVYEFFKRVIANGQPLPSLDRDFVFGIKMYGLRVWEKAGQFVFLPGNEPQEPKVRKVRNGREVRFRPVPIETVEDVRKLEFYIFDGSKRTKIQHNSIESATNRLLRTHHELTLAKVLGSLRKTMAIGEARDVLRQDYNVKDHEFVRIRKAAMALGVFKSGRSTATQSNRFTMDEDVQQFVERVAKQKAEDGEPVPSSQSQLVNQVFRELHMLAFGTRLPKVEKPKTSDKAAESDGKRQAARAE